MPMSRTRTHTRTRNLKDGELPKLLPAMGVFLALVGAGILPAHATCTAVGSNVTCSGAVNPASPSYANGLDNLNVTVNNGATVGVLQNTGGNVMTLTGSGNTLTNNGLIDTLALGPNLGELSSGVVMGNPAGSLETVLNNGFIRGSSGETLALTGLALAVQNGVGGTTTITNTGLITTAPLTDAALNGPDAGVIAAYGGGQINLDNSGTVTGRIALDTSAGGNTFTNSGSVNGSVSMGQNSTNQFIATTGSLVSAAGGTALQTDLDIGSTILRFAATGVVDGGAGGNNTLSLQQGSGATGSIDNSSYINFNHLDVQSGNWTLSGASGATDATLGNGATAVIDNDASLGTGTINSSGGTIQAAVSGLTLSNDIDLAGSGLTVGGTTGLELSGTLSGGGALTKVGTDTLLLSSTNIYTGGTIITAGTLKLGVGGSLAATGDVDLGTAGVGFDISDAGANQTIGALSGVAGTTVSLGANTLTFGTGTNQTFGGAIEGTGGVVKQGSGTQTLTGANTYTGGTTIAAGTLKLGAGGSLAATGDVDLDTAGAGFDISGSGANQTIGALSGVAGTTVTLGPNSLSFGDATDKTFGGTIGGTGGIVKQGSGTETLTGANTYTGSTTINEGTLAISESGSLSGTGTVNLANAGTTLDLSDANAPQTIGGLAGAAGSSIALGSTGLAFGDAGSHTFGGTIGGTGGIVKQGSGTETLTGTNTYTGGTSIVGGTLALGAGGSLASGGALDLGASGSRFDISGSGANQTIGALSGVTGTTVALGGNGLTFGDASDHSYGGTISGTGGIAKAGSGTEILTGANVFTGGTTISAGTLSISSDANLGGTAGALTLNGGTLRVTGRALTTLSRDVVLGSQGGGFDIANSNLEFAVSQALSGTGGLTKQGAGTLVLTGENTYTGGTTIAAGSVLVGTLGRTGSIVGDVVNNGTLGFARVDDVTFAGNISGTGQVAHTGGTLVLTGNNTYTGGTEVYIGALQVGDGGTSGSIVGDVQTFPSAILAFNRSDAYTFAGAISGVGALRQIGSGTLSLTGDSSAFTGTTEVAAGTLSVDGKLGGTLTVDNGTTLAGVGTVGSTTLASGATLAPGNSATPIGTLTVNGDLSLAQGSSYRIQTTLAGASSLVHVTGTADLAGAVVHTGENGTYAASTSYTILTADGGLHGKFDDVSSNLAFLTPSLNYTTNKVDLTMQLKQVPDDSGSGTPPDSGSGGSDPVITPPDTGSGGTRPIRFADLASNGNQRATANALQSLPASSALYSRVLNLAEGQPAGVFAALSGESHASTTRSLQGVASRVGTLTFSHLQANLGAGSVPGPATAQLGRGDASALPQSAAQPVWAQVFGSWSNQSGGNDAARSSTTDSGIFIGGDQAVGGGWRVGGALGYTDSQTSVRDLGSSSDVDSYSATLYGGKAFAAGPGKINLSLGAAYTWHDVKTKRGVDAAGVSQELKSTYGASTGQFFGELGYALPLNDSVTVEPFVGASYDDLRTRGFSESGGDAALDGKSNRNQIASTTLGLHAQSTFESAGAAGRVRATLGWRHAYGDVNPETTMAFQGSQTFTVTGAPIARDSAVVELGVDMAVTKRTTVGLNYGGQFGSGSRQNAGSLDVRYRF